MNSKTSIVIKCNYFCTFLKSSIGAARYMCPFIWKSLLLIVSARNFSYVNLVLLVSFRFLPMTIEKATMTQSQSFQGLAALHLPPLSAFILLLFCLGGALQKTFDKKLEGATLAYMAEYPSPDLILWEWL